MKMKHYSDSNRVGMIRIAYERLRDGAERPLLRALFSLCEKIHEEPDETGRGQAFILASDLFQPLGEGEEIPEYRVECRWNGEPFPDPDHEASRIDAGNFGFVAIRNNIVRVPPIQMTVKPRSPAH